MKIVVLCCFVELLALTAGVVLDINTILLAIIGLVGTSITGFIALRMAAIAADSKENKVATVAAADGIEKIHVAVNSERSAMMATLKQLTAEILTLSGTVKTLEEGKRQTELAKAVADAQGKVVMPVSVAPIMSAPAPAAIAQPAPAAPEKRIDSEIEELTDAAKETSKSADITTDLAKKHPR